VSTYSLTPRVVSECNAAVCTVCRVGISLKMEYKRGFSSLGIPKTSNKQGVLIQQLNLPSTSDPCACLLLLLLYHQQEEMMSGRRRITVLFVALLTLISCVSHGTVFAVSFRSFVSFMCVCVCPESTERRM
jgi:hypothetical protein